MAGLPKLPGWLRVLAGSVISFATTGKIGVSYTWTFGGKQRPDVPSGGGEGAGDRKP